MIRVQCAQLIQRKLRAFVLLGLDICARQSGQRVLVVGSSFGSLAERIYSVGGAVELDQGQPEITLRLRVLRVLGDSGNKNLLCLRELLVVVKVYSTLDIGGKQA